MLLFLFMCRKTESGYLTPLKCVNVDVLKPFSELLAGWFCERERDAWSIMLSLVGCCLKGMCIEEFHREYGGASPDVVLKFRKVPVRDMTRFCNRLLRESIRMAKKCRVLTGFFCVDYTDVEYYGAPAPYTFNAYKEAGGKKKIRRGFRYGVSCMARPGARYFLGVMPYRKGVGVNKTVKYLAKQAAHDVDWTLSMFDKGFVNMDSFDTLEGMGKDYVLPFRKNKTLDKLWKGRDILVEYKMRKHGGGWKLVNILLETDECKKKQYRAYVYPLGITLTEAKRRARLYRYRWNQETGHRCRKYCAAWTKSPSASYRLLLFTISLLVSNLWFLLKQTGNQVTQTGFCLRFLDMIRRVQDEISAKYTVFGTSIQKTSWITAR